MGKGHKPFRTGFVEVDDRTADLVDVIDKMGAAVTQSHIPVWCALHVPVLGRERPAVVPLIASGGQGAVPVIQLDDHGVQLEFLEQQPQQIIHNDLQVKCAIDDFRSFKPYI